MTTDSPSVEAILDDVAVLGESPVWDGRLDRLYWIDIDRKIVHRTDPVDGTDETRTLGGRPGSIALTDEPDRLLVSIENNFDASREFAGRPVEIGDGPTPGA